MKLVDDLPQHRLNRHIRRAFERVAAARRA
jgi:hypothetical protein